ncbi:hypothetical protein Y032_0026g1476 [Ancylostoma ceylanicum]|uniref:Uncharacterized protein n=1 Tax=Ancylostoma ceylanicum TaxID=53326 RepID=A0A016UWV3_9BILA|nr:hypothetical protein Y032_0026g1476 [Ancylostoma ceylanicum]
MITEAPKAKTCPEAHERTEKSDCGNVEGERTARTATCSTVALERSVPIGTRTVPGKFLKCLIHDETISEKIPLISTTLPTPWSSRHQHLRSYSAAASHLHYPRPSKTGRLDDIDIR